MVHSPKTDWEASAWLFTSIGDVFYSGDNLEAAMASYYDALNCPDVMGNAYIHLSLGQVQYELKEHDKSRASFLRAYMLEGDDIFEDEDPKYFDAIRDLI
ncbi:tetratricopeptide repeat protein [Maribacter sp.]|nr:tetratricopeptide repeat protein [Maribacter sp.]